MLHDYDDHAFAMYAAISGTIALFIFIGITILVNGEDLRQATNALNNCKTTAQCVAAKRKMHNVNKPWWVTPRGWDKAFIEQR